MRDEKIEIGPDAEGDDGDDGQEEQTPISAPPPARMESLRSRRRRAIMQILSQCLAKAPSSGPSGHLLPAGEKRQFAANTMQHRKL
jgi:hypothetical protein